MTRNQELMKYVKQLVADNSTAVDAESGLCRYCEQTVEGFDPQELQEHLPNCPWMKVREMVGAA